MYQVKALHPMPLASVGVRINRGRQSKQLMARGYKVDIEHEGKVHKLEIEEGTTVLEAAEENGLELPHDCRLGVCMTCPARLVSGKVDQSGSMLSEDVEDQGYALLCVSQPLTDCAFKTIPEEEVLQLQLKTSEM